MTPKYQTESTGHQQINGILFSSHVHLSRWAVPVPAEWLATALDDMPGAVVMTPRVALAPGKFTPNVVLREIQTSWSAASLGRSSLARLQQHLNGFLHIVGLAEETLPAPENSPTAGTAGETEAFFSYSVMNTDGRPLESHQAVISDGRTALEITAMLESGAALPGQPEGDRVPFGVLLDSIAYSLRPSAHFPEGLVLPSEKDAALLPPSELDLDFTPAPCSAAGQQMTAGAAEDLRLRLIFGAEAYPAVTVPDEWAPFDASLDRARPLTMALHSSSGTSWATAFVHGDTTLFVSGAPWKTAPGIEQHPDDFPEDPREPGQRMTARADLIPSMDLSRIVLDWAGHNAAQDLALPERHVREEDGFVLDTVSPGCEGFWDGSLFDHMTVETSEQWDRNGLISRILDIGPAEEGVHAGLAFLVTGQPVFFMEDAEQGGTAFAPMTTAVNIAEMLAVYGLLARGD